MGIQILPCIDKFQKSNQDTLGVGSFRGKIRQEVGREKEKSHQFQNFAD